MKHSLPLLLIAFCSAKAGAFQAKTDASKLTAFSTASLDYRDPGAAQTLNITTIHPGLCSATPITGCHCPFCTRLRMQTE